VRFAGDADSSGFDCGDEINADAEAGIIPSSDGVGGSWTTSNRGQCVTPRSESSATDDVVPCGTKGVLSWGGGGRCMSMIDVAVCSAALPAGTGAAISSSSSKPGEASC